MIETTIIPDYGSIECCECGDAASIILEVGNCQLELCDYCASRITWELEDVEV